MKLDKAIEILKLDLDDPGSCNYGDRAEAQQLGIEALNYIKRSRSWGRYPVCRQLPGEEPESTPTRSLHHIKAVLESPLGREPRG